MTNKLQLKVHDADDGDDEDDEGCVIQYEYCIVKILLLTISKVALVACNVHTSSEGNWPRVELLFDLRFSRFMLTCQLSSITTCSLLPTPAD